MKVLSIGTDRLIFDTKSDVRQRAVGYGGLFDELHIIVFTHEKLGYKREELENKVFIYPTNSIGRSNYIWDAIKIGKKLLTNSQDWVITSQDPFETGLVAWWLKNRFKVKWQAQIHTDLMSPYFKRESLKNRVRVILAKWLLSKADKIRVVSQRIKDSLKNLPLKSEPIVLPIFVTNPVDEICDSNLNLHKKYPHLSFIILMASRLTIEKNFPLALMSFAEVMRHQPCLGLVIVGRGPEKLKLQQLAKTLNTGHQIIFEDWNNNLDCYYRSADLFMLSSNYEGYGRTLAEAGLNGCPVLTTDVGLVGEIVSEDNALICPVGDGECLSEKIGWAISDKNNLQRLGQQLKHDLEKSQLSKEEYLQKYKEALMK